MVSLDKAEAEISRGRFQEALRFLAEPKSRRPPHEALALSIVMADVLQRTGQSREAVDLAKAGLRSPARTPATDSRCLNTLALAASESGQLRQGLSLFQRAKAAAESGNDTAEVCRILLDLLANVSDSMSSDVAAVVLNDCKRAVATVGHADLEVRLHIVAAEIEGKRGLLNTATSHLRAAEAMLSTRPNAWLEGLLYLNLSTIHALSGRPQAGLELAAKALDRAETSGHKRTRIGAIANLAYLSLWNGLLDDAETRCQQGLDLVADMSEPRMALLETQAQVMLARGDWDRCDSLLTSIQVNSSRDRGFRTSWYGLVATLTRARLQLQQRSWEDCLDTSVSAVALADERGDSLHGVSLRVLGADALIELGRTDEAAAWVDEAARRAEGAPTASYAEVERARAALVAHTSGPSTAKRQFDRALRVLAAEGGAAARMDAAGSYLRTMKPANEKLRRLLADKPFDLSPLVSSGRQGSSALSQPRPGSAPNPRAVGLSEAAPLMRLAQRADLLAHEAFVLVSESGCAEALAVLECEGEQVVNVAAHIGCTADEAAQLPCKHGNRHHARRRNQGSRHFNRRAAPPNRRDALIRTGRQNDRRERMGSAGTS